MSVMPVGDAADRVAQNLDRRLRHVLVVVRRARFAQIFEHPCAFLPGLDVRLVPDAREVAKFPEATVWP